jgi:hypothetical protein
MAAAARDVQELCDRVAIADLTLRYCRGVDRCDLALLSSVFWDDAQAHYGIYDGRALEFAELTVRTVRESCQATMHLIANQTLELHGEQGAGETYVVAYHSIESLASIGALLKDPALTAPAPQGAAPPGSAAPCSFVVGGRYLDRFTRRNYEWRIQERSYVWDWCEQGPPNLMFHAGESTTSLPIGRRSRSDPSYAFLGLRT